MVEAGDRLHDLVHEGAWEGFGSCVLDYDHYSLTVCSKRPLPQEVENLLDELRRDVSIDVHEALYSSDELIEEAHRISGLELPGIRITTVSPLRDCSGLRMTVDVDNDLARASREIESRMKLGFGVQAPPRWIPAGLG